jgi:hypothetical protein
MVRSDTARRPRPRYLRIQTLAIREEVAVPRFKMSLLAAGLALAVAPAEAATVSTAWVQLGSGDQEECLSIGSRVLESSGFRASISQDRQTVFGWRGEEALTVRCIAGHRLAVVFAWVNDQSNDSGPLVEGVTRAFRNRVAPQGGGNLTGGGGGNFGGGGGNLGPGTFGGAPPSGGTVKR